MSGENAEQPADAIVAELEKVSEDAEKTEREARDASEGFPQGTPEWYKTIKRAERANQPKEQKADGERRGVIIYSSNKAREMREGNNIRENYFRQKAEEMAEAARDRALALYSADRMVAEYRALYADLHHDS